MENLKDIISKSRLQNRTAQQRLYAYTYGELSGAVGRYARDNSERDWIFNLGMMRVFTSLDNYQLGTNFLGWARTILVRATIDHLRSNKSHQQNIAPVAVEEQHAASSDFDQLMNEIDTDAILLLLQRLPEKERMIFNLYEIEGYNHQEIQEMTEINRNTSKWLLAKSKKSLRKMITQSTDIKKYTHGK